MTTLSEPTLGLVVQVAVDTRTRDQLGTLLFRAGLESDREAHRAVTFVRSLVEQTVLDPEDPPRWFGELRESLLSDGYELT